MPEPSVVSPATPLLVTIPNVDLMSVGEWPAAEGPGIWTRDHLASAVAAQHDPGFSAPRVKIGHSDPRFDGNPAFGTIANMRLIDDGMKLVGDLVAVPKWFAEAAPSAYPTRSIEGYYNSTSGATNKYYPFHVTALAMLGETPPAIANLEDLRILLTEGIQYEEPAMAAQNVCGEPARIYLNTMGEPMPTQQNSFTAASMNVDDVVRAYYDDMDEEYPSWWVREIRLNPDEVICTDDKTGKQYRIPFTVADEAITFAEPVEVKMVYQDVATPAAASQRLYVGSCVKVYASRSESRPTNNNQEDNMPINVIRERLGVAEDATDEEVLKAFDAALANSAIESDTNTDENNDNSDADEDANTPVADADKVLVTAKADGVMTIDAAELASLKAEAAMGRQALERQQTTDRDNLLGECVKAGKFPPSRKDHWQKLYDVDPDGTRETLASLASGLIPVTGAKGHNATTPVADDSYPSSWLPELSNTNGGK